MAMRRSRIKMAPNLGAKARGPGASRPSASAAKPVSDSEDSLTAIKTHPKLEPSDDTFTTPTPVLLAKVEPEDMPAVMPSPPARPLPVPTPSPPAKALPMVPPSPPAKSPPAGNFSPPAKPMPGQSPTRTLVVVSPPARTIQPSIDLAVGPIVPAEALIGISKITPMSDAEDVDSDGSQSRTVKPDPDMNKSPMARVRNRFPKAKPNLSETGRGRIRHNSVTSRDEEDYPAVQKVLSRQRQPSVSETIPSPLKTPVSNNDTVPAAFDCATPAPEPVRPPITNSLGIDMGSAVIKKAPRFARDEDGNRRKPKKMVLVDGPIDRSKVTMRDLIYMNPSGNRMKSTLAEKERQKKLKQEKIKSESGGEEDAQSVMSEASVREEIPPEIIIPKEDTVKEDTDPVPTPTETEENNETTDGTTPEPEPEAEPEPENLSAVPQVTIGVNGEIILNESSLLLDNKDPDADEKAAAMELVHESDYNMSRFAYGRKHATKLWTEMETKKFYLALSAVGTDFSLMGNLFPKRTRTELKRKFKREERINRSLIDRAIREQQQFDMEFFDNLVALQIDEPVDKRKRKSMKTESESTEDQENQTATEGTRTIKSEEKEEKKKEKEKKRIEKVKIKEEKKIEQEKIKEEKKIEKEKKREAKNLKKAQQMEIKKEKAKQKAQEQSKEQNDEHSNEQEKKKRSRPSKKDTGADVVTAVGSSEDPAGESEAAEPEARPKRTRRKSKGLTYIESGEEAEDSEAEWTPPADANTGCAETLAGSDTETPKRKRGRKPKVKPAIPSPDGEPKPKRQRRKSKIMQLIEREGEEVEPEPEASCSNTVAEGETPKRKRGRPSKAKPTEPATEPGASCSNTVAEEETPKRKRGRPPKAKPTEPATEGTETTPKPKRQRKTSKKTHPALLEALTAESSVVSETATITTTDSMSETGHPMTAQEHLRLLEGEPVGATETSTAPMDEAPLSQLLETTDPTANPNHQYVFVASPPPVGSTGADAEPLIHVYLVSPTGGETLQPPEFPSGQPNTTAALNGEPHHPTPSPMGSPTTDPHTNPLASPLTSPRHIPIVIVEHPLPDPPSTVEPASEDDQRIQESMQIDQCSGENIDIDQQDIDQRESVQAEGEMADRQDDPVVVTGSFGDGDASDKTELRHISETDQTNESTPAILNSESDFIPKISETQEISTPQTRQTIENTQRPSEPEQIDHQPLTQIENSSGQSTPSSRQSDSGGSDNLETSQSEKDDITVISKQSISQISSDSNNPSVSELTITLGETNVEKTIISETPLGTENPIPTEVPVISEKLVESEKPVATEKPVVAPEKPEVVSVKQEVALEKLVSTENPVAPEKPVSSEKPGAMKGRRRRIMAMPKIPNKRRPAAPAVPAAQTVQANAETGDGTTSQPIDEATASGILLEMSSLGEG